MLTENKEQLAKVKKVLVDRGYRGEVLANQVKGASRSGGKSSQKERIALI
jgi:hypothetical protein